MADSSKTWSLHTVPANAATDHIVPASGAVATIAVSRFVNTGGAAGTLTVTRTDADGALVATLVPGVNLDANSVYELRGLKVINPHKIQVKFSQTTLDCDSCGKEV